MIENTKCMDNAKKLKQKIIINITARTTYRNKIILALKFDSKDSRLGSINKIANKATIPTKKKNRLI